MPIKEILGFIGLRNNCFPYCETDWIGCNLFSSLLLSLQLNMRQGDLTFKIELCPKNLKSEKKQTPKAKPKSAKSLALLLLTARQAASSCSKGD